jgi:serine/threonine protein phosphatase 1
MRIDRIDPVPPLQEDLSPAREDHGRTLAIGDIHGCARALDALLTAVNPRPEDLLITLGDHVNWGPDTRSVIARLIHLSAECNLISLRGNHEQMMLDARNSPRELALFRKLGGDATLRSYAASGMHASLADVPDDHWRFLESTREFYETETHFFVHATADPHLPLDSQPPAILFWGPFRDPSPHVSGKIMVCGHTPQDSGEPRNLGHAICIDTHAHAGGWLTCLDTRSGHLWQSTDSGEIREASLEAHRVPH